MNLDALWRRIMACDKIVVPDNAAFTGGCRDDFLCHDWDFLLRSTYFTAPVFVDVHAYDYRVHQSNTFRAVDHLAEAETRQVLARFFIDFSHHPKREVMMANEKFKQLVADDPYKSSWNH